ncbi:hypothetical protein BJV74DRAFT_866413 [Russula compacta]|nr:hypothetical protein BJV74DRAFT_866413 [Russula compacta]
MIQPQSAVSHIMKTSFTAKPIPGGGAILEGTAGGTDVSFTPAFRSLSSSMLMLAPRSDVISVELPLCLEFPSCNLITHELTSPSSSATKAGLHVALQVTSISDAHATANIRALSRNDDTHGLNPPIPMEAFPHPNQSTLPAPNTIPGMLRSEHGHEGQSQL